MATYTAVLVVPEELDQEYVQAQLERLGIVAFLGPGSLVQDIDPEEEELDREAEGALEAAARRSRARAGVASPEPRPGPA